MTCNDMETSTFSQEKSDRLNTSHHNHVSIDLYTVLYLCNVKCPNFIGTINLSSANAFSFVSGKELWRVRIVIE